MDEENKIRAAFILDIIGRPPEHLIETLEKVIESIDKEKGVVVKTKSVKNPEPLKDNKEFYTTFAEVEVEVDEIISLAIILFKYMPAHLEVISPEVLALSNSGWNDILNELVRRLHGYDEIARVMQAERNMLQQKIKEITGHDVITPLSRKPSDFKQDTSGKKKFSQVKKPSKRKTARKK